MKKPFNKGITRRDFLKASGLGAAATVISEVRGVSTAAGKSKRLAMVIDLQRCGACGACIIACKSENNVQLGFLWANKITRTVGEFPNVRYEFIPTLCNHCEIAPCVAVCPTGALYKGYGDITMHDPEKCIGCKLCIEACPYYPPYYNVLQFHEEIPHQFWRDDRPLMEGVTPSAVQVTQKVGGEVIPYYNPAKEAFRPGSGLRRKDIVEKCTLCDHRVTKGELPFCVEACPADARIFGDLNDPNSEVSVILRKFPSWRLKEEVGTKPKVFYIRSFTRKGPYKM